MNDYLKHSLFSVLCAVMLLALNSCKQDQPVQQPPVTDTTKSTPTGMPDWNDPQYDWLLTHESLCAQRYTSRDYWTPKFGFLVMDASPDGKRILLSLGN